MSNKQDIIFLKRALDGDERAFASLVDKYKDYIFHLADTITNDSQLAEEVAQDTFLKAYKSLHTFRQEAKFSSWLYKICYYTAISQSRKKYHKVHVMASDYQPEFLQYSDEFDGLEILNHKERVKIINSALEKLPSAYRSVLTLFYLNECSLKEIAEITAYSASNIKSILFRGRKKLFDELSEQLKHESRSII